MSNHSIFTTAGKNYLARKALENKGLDVHQIILANIPNLSESAERNPGMLMPHESQIVHKELNLIEGYVTDNSIAWGAVLSDEVGDFDYNFMGLVAKDNTLLAIDYLPVQRKRKGANNVHNRSFVLTFAGAKALTKIEIPAASWMFNYSPQLNAIQQSLMSIATATLTELLRGVKRDDELLNLKKLIRISQNKLNLI